MVAERPIWLLDMGVIAEWAVFSGVLLVKKLQKLDQFGIANGVVFELFGCYVGGVRG